MYRLLLFILIPILCFGCNEWLGDNKNPNMLSDAPINALLTAVIEQTADNQFQVSLTTSLYAQYLASPNASEIDRYGRVTLDDCWTSLYKCMADANDLYIAANNEKDYHHAGAALVLLSYNALTATDLWGDIPFSKAFKGQLELHPKYDTQEIVYDTILQSLDKAITLLKQPNPFRVLDGDILYNNKPALWIKFAYALKARTLMHLAKKSNLNASQILTSIDSSFSSNNDGALLAYAGNKVNPWYNLVNSMINGGVLNGYISAQFIESLAGSNQPGMPFDPRINAVTDTIKGGIYIGTTNGAPSPATGFCTMTFNSWQAQKTASIILLSYSEVKFIEAEIALLANNQTRAYNAYIEAIDGDFKLRNMNTSETNDYLVSPAIAVGSANLSFSQIQYQKWIALALQPEGWFDVRCNNYVYPGMKLPIDNLTNDEFIQRILYPNSERSYNGDNVPDISEVTELLWINMK